MNVYDIVILVLLVYSLWSGWRSGIIMQFSGIVGILLGAWVASRFSKNIVEWLDIKIDNELWLYIAIVVVVMIAVIIVLRLFNRIVQWGGLSVPVKLLGAVASVLKFVLVMALVQSLVMGISERVDIGKGNKVAKSMKESVSYDYLDKISGLVYPYLMDIVHKVWTKDETSPRGEDLKMDMTDI